MATQGWFEVDPLGWAKVARRKGMAFILHELLQNAYDTEATKVTVELVPIPGKPMARLIVEDNDPTGFVKLDHAFTLFAESLKKSDPTKRGRFNQGEKNVIACCEQAKVQSTTGTVYFERNGKELQRRQTREKSRVGSRFEAELRVTRDELQEMLTSARRVIPAIETWVNGERLPEYEVLAHFEAQLPTEISDEDGNLRKSTRKTEVRIVPQYDGVSYCYELGIPIVEIELPWSIDVRQKVPQNSDRDNITPAYRKLLAASCLNVMHGALTKEAAALPLVQEALGHERVSDEAVRAVVTQQYGEHRVTYDPSDKEASHNAVAKGYAVIHGGAYTKEQWAAIKRAQAAEPAGKVFPTERCYDQDGDPARIIPEAEWTEGMRTVALYAQWAAWKVFGVGLHVVMEKERSQRYVANFSRGDETSRLVFNVPKLSAQWFDMSRNFVSITDLLIHELAHQMSNNHLDSDYHDALSRIGAQMMQLALDEPEALRRFQRG
jgi:hypothetical protein